MNLVLVYYKLTRFSNLVFECISRYIVLVYYKLTRFSNLVSVLVFVEQVLVYYKLTRFSNPNPLNSLCSACFSILQTYKVLKQSN